MDKKAKKVKVVIRVRPTLREEDESCVSVRDNSVEIFNHRNVNENIHYDFSAVYGMQSTQHQIYTECVESLIPQALAGQNVAIFAYGPTGAGKTHTMLGTASNPGVTPHVVDGLFKKIAEQQKESSEWNYKVTFSYLEIYNEKVQDLLEPRNADLPIREDADKNILVPGLARKEINNCEEFTLAFGPASNNRTVAATKLNNRSSRSHSIVQLMVTKSKPCHRLDGKIYLIDLAGSEDNRKTGNKGIRLKESGAINRSLFALGEVVDAINSGLPRIPYRNSKLTRLLQDSIGGTCHSVMITNIAPEERYYYDTYCTLNFATKSKKIVNNTCTKETIVKPVALVRKTPPCPDLPEEENKRKRQKMTDSEADMPPRLSDPAPMLSPLLRRQMKHEEAVHQRLADLEKNLMQQMKSLHGGAVPSTPRSLGIASIKQQLEENNRQLKTLASQHLQTQRADKKEDCPPILSDCTNVPPTKRALAKGRSFKKEPEFSCSPLFAPPRRLQQKGFTSSAKSSRVRGGSGEPNSVENTSVASFNPSVQEKRNETFLHLLNSSSIKDLQSLQTVGAKRAKLIFDWRETYGSFSHLEDLKKIPGFTEKFIQKLLFANLITAS